MSVRPRLLGVCATTGALTLLPIFGASAAHAADTAPPSFDEIAVSVVGLPADAPSITEAGPSTFVASVTDDVGVARVEFYRDGDLLGVDDSAPFELTVDFTAADNGASYFYARALDASGNESLGFSRLSGIAIDGEGDDYFSWPIGF